MWDLADSNPEAFYDALTQKLAAPTPNVALPPGFAADKPSAAAAKSKKRNENATATEKDGVQAMNALKLKKAWETAFAPAKAIPMNAFMLWMSGSSIQIFSIMITLMMFWNGIKGLLATNATLNRFAPSADSRVSLEQPSLVKPKAVHAFFQACLISLGLYKCWSMGLLPTAASDWLFAAAPIPYSAPMLPLLSQ